MRVKFEFYDDTIDNVQFIFFEFESTLKVRDMINMFLNKNKSEKKIKTMMFLYKGKNLNCSKFLDKNIKDIFNSYFTNIVKVYEPNFIA